MHAERNPPTEPPCETCWVDLDKANEEAAHIYGLVQGQIITRHNGQYDEIVDLNYSAVKIVMDLYEVKKQRECFEKVLKTFHVMLNRSREKNA
jgi:iron uptake system EfeUOB component EfeO/EfeM